MRLAVASLLLAVVLIAACFFCFLLFEPMLGPAFAFGPGFAAQWVLEQFGVAMPNRALLWVTLLFWWPVLWLFLLALRRSRARAAASVRR